MAATNGRKVQPKRPDYSTMSQDELIRLLQRRDTLTETKVGLVWDRECIAPDKALNTDFVMMDAVSDLHCGKGPYDNLVIEGDNFDSLRWLNMTHKGKVQCIYIDPPYNTGSANFVYTDRFETSQWLEFLASRLRLAKDLLSDDGVILASIDDANRDLLKLLMDEIFPGMFIGSFVWRTRTASGGEKFFSLDHEHVLIYGAPNFNFRGQKKTYAAYDNPDNDPRGEWFRGDLSFGYQYLSPAAGTLFYPLENPATGDVYPCNPNRVWVYASEKHIKPDTKLKSASMEEWIRRGQVIWPENPNVVVWRTLEDIYKAIDRKEVPYTGKSPLLYRGLPEDYLRELLGKRIAWGRPQFKRFKKDLKTDTQPTPSWIRPRSEDPPEERVDMVCGETREGSRAIRDIFGKRMFDYPKPPSLLKELVRQATKPDSIVIDFFAGSGTTAHAVLAVNAEDDGNRRFIMCSEQNGKSLCSDVLAERLRRVVNGYADVKGTGGNFAYLRAARLPVEHVPLGTLTRAAKLTDEQVWNLIQTMHGCPLQPACKRYVIHNGEAIVYSPDGAKTDLCLVRSLVAKKLKVTVYSWNPRSFASVKNNIAIHALPEALLSSLPGLTIELTESIDMI